MNTIIKLVAVAATSLCASTLSAQTYFTPRFSAVTAETAMQHSGIDNMDRYSFAGEQFTTGKQTKNGWGKSSLGEYLDFMGVSPTQLPEGYTNQNNDWIVSEPIDLTSAKNPVAAFTLFQNYGVDNTNTLSMWVCTTGYEKGEERQETAGDVKTTPKGDWKLVENNICCNANNTTEEYVISLAAYKGLTVRIALRATNRLKQNQNNTRLYRVENLQVREK